MKYLLDTCTISYFLKGNDNIINHLKPLSPSDLAVSVITILEIDYGFKLKTSKELIQLHLKWLSFLDALTVLEFNNKTALIASDIRAFLKLSGNPIGAYDILIGATALEHELICVTNNLSEFERIKELKLEDWSI